MFKGLGETLLGKDGAKVPVASITGKGTQALPWVNATLIILVMENLVLASTVAVSSVPAARAAACLAAIASIRPLLALPPPPGPNKIIALYFSAHWCPPCRGFTPHLASIYKDFKAKHPRAADWEVVFVSSDRDEKSFQEYFDEMPWLALPFEDREAKAALSQKYKVRSGTAWLRKGILLTSACLL